MCDQAKAISAFFRSFLVTAATAAASVSQAQVGDPPSDLAISIHHRTGQNRSSYLHSKLAGGGYLNLYVAPKSAAKGAETNYRVMPPQGHAVLEITSDSEAVYVEKSAGVAADVPEPVEDSLGRAQPEGDPDKIPLSIIPWWVVRSKAAFAGADGTEFIMVQKHVPDASDPKNEVTIAIFVKKSFDASKVILGTGGAAGPVQTSKLVDEGTYSEHKWVGNKWIWTEPAPVDDGNVNAKSEIEQVVERFEILKKAANNPVLD